MLARERECSPPAPSRREGSFDEPIDFIRAAQGKYGHGVALTPHAEALFTSITHGSKRRAVQLLMTLFDEGRSLEEIEQNVLAPAVARLGELWIRGRLDDSAFQYLGSLAEQVERDFRRQILMLRNSI